MKVLVYEMAEALRYSEQTICTQYVGRDMMRKYDVIDTEIFASILNVDHRYIMAFLAGYDRVLTSHEAAAFVGRFSSRGLSKHWPPVIRLSHDNRWSTRKLVYDMQEKLKGKRSGYRPYPKHSISTLRPPPDHLPPTDWGWRSAVELLGAGLPRAYRTTLRDGSHSTLPVPDGAEWWTDRDSDR